MYVFKLIPILLFFPVLAQKTAEWEFKATLEVPQPMPPGWSQDLVFTSGAESLSIRVVIVPHDQVYVPFKVTYASQPPYPEDSRNFRVEWPASGNNAFITLKPTFKKDKAFKTMKAFRREMREYFAEKSRHQLTIRRSRLLRDLSPDRIDALKTIKVENRSLYGLRLPDGRIFTPDPEQTWPLLDAVHRKATFRLKDYILDFSKTPVLEAYPGLIPYSSLERGTSAPGDLKKQPWLMREGTNRNPGSRLRRVAFEPSSETYFLTVALPEDHFFFYLDSGFYLGFSENIIFGQLKQEGSLLEVGAVSSSPIKPDEKLTGKGLPVRRTGSEWQATLPVSIKQMRQLATGKQWKADGQAIDLVLEFSDPDWILAATADVPYLERTSKTRFKVTLPPRTQKLPLTSHLRLMAKKGRRVRLEIIGQRGEPGTALTLKSTKSGINVSPLGADAFQAGLGRYLTAEKPGSIKLIASYPDPGLPEFLEPEEDTPLYVISLPGSYTRDEVDLQFAGKPFYDFTIQDQSIRIPQGEYKDTFTLNLPFYWPASFTLLDMKVEHLDGKWSSQKEGMMERDWLKNLNARAATLQGTVRLPLIPGASLGAKSVGQSYRVVFKDKRMKRNLIDLSIKPGTDETRTGYHLEQEIIPGMGLSEDRLVLNGDHLLSHLKDSRFNEVAQIQLRYFFPKEESTSQVWLLMAGGVMVILLLLIILGFVLRSRQKRKMRELTQI